MSQMDELTKERTDQIYLIGSEQAPATLEFWDPPFEVVGNQPCHRRAHARARRLDVDAGSTSEPVPALTYSGEIGRSGAISRTNHRVSSHQRVLVGLVIITPKTINCKELPHHTKTALIY